MKPITTGLSKNNTCFFFTLIPLLLSKWRLSIFIFAGSILLVGCFRKFYTTETTHTIDSNRIRELKTANRYFIIHYKDSTLALDSLSVSDNSLMANREALPAVHTTQLNPKPDKSNAFPKRLRKAVLAEVHFYVKDTSGERTINYPQAMIPLPDIYRMDVYKFDEQRTKTGVFLSILGMVLAIGLYDLLAHAAAFGEL